MKFDLSSEGCGRRKQCFRQSKQAVQSSVAEILYHRNKVNVPELQGLKVRVPERLTKVSDHQDFESHIIFIYISLCSEDYLRNG